MFGGEGGGGFGKFLEKMLEAPKIKKIKNKLDKLK